MSDAALLVRAMRPGPPRALIGVHVLAFCAAIGAIVLWVGPSPTGGWTRAIFLGCLFGWVPGAIAVLTLVVYFDERLGPVAYEEELLRRAGWLAHEELVAQAETALTEMPGPGWLLLFYGRALPHGGQHFVRVSLFQDRDHPSPMRYGGLRFYAVAGDRDPRRRVYHGQGELLPDEREEFFELLGAWQQSQKSATDEGPGTRVSAPDHTGATSQVRDGYPFELHALRRGPGDSLRKTGNLADSQSLAPVRQLAARMLDIAQGAGADRTRYGTVEEGHLVFTER